MAKKNKYDQQHLRNLSVYELRIDRIYQEAIREAATIGAQIGSVRGDGIFSFKDYPATRTRVERLMQTLKNKMLSVVVNGIDAEWSLSNNKNSELARQVFGKNVGRLSQSQYRRYFSTNDAARQQFQQRRVDGLNLSDRVWQYTNQFKGEIELGLDLGIRSGRSADQMSRDLREYLRHPDKLFRRVRDEHGILRLSERAKQFHSGQGVYRSSYKNARRLASTETNIAYRTADHERWKKFDFVVGIEIRLSNNHTCLGADGKPHEFTDICDELCGRYPKDFKFTGWHPHCRCYAVSILKTQAEIAEDTRRILNGEKTDGESVNRVTDVPEAFKVWAENNRDRAANCFSVPYFVKDNLKYLPDGYADLYGSKTPYDTVQQYREAMRFNAKNAGFSDTMRQNNSELSKVLPIIQGKIMNFTEADGGLSNPHYSDNDARTAGYHHNCQTCTVSYELRRRGFSVEAAPAPKNGDEFYKSWCKKHSFDWKDRFLNPDGTRPEYTFSGRATSYSISDKAADKQKFIETTAAEVGRYEIYVTWKGGKGAHVFCVERQADGNLLWYDPQSGVHGGAEAFSLYLKQMQKYKIGVLRVDDKIINPKFAERLRKSSK